MVGHRFVEELVTLDRGHRFDVNVVGAEEYEPYNRILLTEVLARRCDVAALALPRPPDRVAVRRGVSATSIDRAVSVVRLDDGTDPGHPNGAPRRRLLAGLRPPGAGHGGHRLRASDRGPT